jgi:AcrR family transcriptional regulator
MTTTKDSILNAAEKLFAERGFDATSLRAITTAAGSNLASVNYHFQSKEKLLQALFSRRLEKLNRKRMERMDRYEAAYGEKPVPLGKLIRALIEPMFDSSDISAGGGNTFGMLMGRMYSAPQSTLENLLLADIRYFAERFGSAIRKTLPGIPPEDLYWRTFFALGSTVHTLASSHLLRQISRGLCDPENTEKAMEKLTAFIVAGFKAPAGKRNPKKPSHKYRKNNKGI